MASMLFRRSAKKADDADRPKMDDLLLAADPKNPEIDIVAVPGFGHGGAEKPWKADNGLVWLRDFLPMDIPEARILLFEPDSRPPSPLSIAASAETLLSLLRRRRKGASGRPIIFFAYSLGGQIVKKALLTAKADLTYESIYTSTFGIVFFATNHLRDRGERFHKLLQLDFGRSSAVEISKAIAELNHQFSFEMDNLWVLSCYETLASRKVGVIVGEAAASSGGRRERLLAMHADHQTISKFSNASDTGYMMVSYNVRAMARAAIEATVEKPRIRASTSDSPPLSLPYYRDAMFAGREDILETIDRTLQDPDTLHRVSLVGMGGIGKTHIAVEYVYRRRMRDPSLAVFWIKANNIENLSIGYRDVASHLRVPGLNNERTKMLSQVRIALETHPGNWLLILDDVSWGLNEFGPLIFPYIPHHGRGSIIMTSRTTPATLGVWTEVSVGGLPNLEASELLIRVAGDSRLQDPHLIPKLIDILKGLPLAVVLAAWALKGLRCTVEEYLSSFSRHLSDHLSQENNSLEGILRQTLIQISPEAVKLLLAMSVMSSERIPLSLLREVIDDSAVLGGALRVLQGHSLITEDPTIETCYILHRKIQEIVQRIASEEEREARTFQALQSVLNCFPEPDYENRELCELLVPHARTLVDSPSVSIANSLERASLLSRLANFVTLQGDYNLAEEFEKKALEIREKRFGQDDPETLSSLSNLSIRLNNVGKLGESEAVARRALEGFERVLGKEHWSTITSVQNLGITLHNQGRYEEAVQLIRRSLLASRHLGDDHPNTLSTMNILAEYLIDQGKYENAEIILRQVIASLEKVLGPEHPRRLKSLSSLASVFFKLGNVSEAERLQEEAADGLARAYGADHPQTLRSRAHLALILNAHQGSRREQAIRIALGVLRSRDKILGPSHRDTLESIDNVVLILRDSRQDEAAENLLKIAFEERKYELGEDNPCTLEVKTRYVTVLRDLGKHSEADHLTGRSGTDTEQSYIGGDLDKTEAQSNIEDSGPRNRISDSPGISPVDLHRSDSNISLPSLYSSSTMVDMPFTAENVAQVLVANEEFAVNLAEAFSRPEDRMSRSRLASILKSYADGLYYVADTDFRKSISEFINNQCGRIADAVIDSLQIFPKPERGLTKATLETDQFARARVDRGTLLWDSGPIQQGNIANFAGEFNFGKIPKRATLFEGVPDDSPQASPLFEYLSLGGVDSWPQQEHIAALEDSHTSVSTTSGLDSEAEGFLLSGYIFDTLLRATKPSAPVEADDDPGSPMDTDDDFGDEGFGPEPAELTRHDERLVHPQKYFTELERLIFRVINKSAFMNLPGEALRTELDPRGYDLLINLEHPTNDPELEVSHLSKSKEILENSMQSLRLLTAHGFCTSETFSLLAEDTERVNVVRLVTIEGSTILGVLNSIRGAETALLDSTRRETEGLREVTEHCRNVLCQIGLPHRISEEGSGIERICVITCRILAHVIDLALVSYCGSHVEALNIPESFGHTLGSIEVESIRIGYAGSENSGIIILKRQPFACLHHFLKDRDAWVFSIASWTPEVDDPDPRFFLSTTIEAFADIWGPAWKICPLESTDTVIQYNTGGGKITASSNSDGNHVAPLLDETICHWTKGQTNENSLHIGRNPGRLLIGAMMHRRADIHVTKETILAELEQKDPRFHLEPPGPHRSYSMHDTTSLGMQFQALGIALNGQLAYKIHPQLPWKTSVIQAWNNEGNDRNPRVLNLWFGLEISLCTGNARRVRLKELLQLTTMRNFILGRRPHWVNSDSGREFYTALESHEPGAFETFYHNSIAERKKEIGEVVGLCFAALERTGQRLEENNGHLYGFWVPNRSEEHILIWPQHDHTWIGMLKDSRAIGVMAAVTERCLLFDHNKYGMPCREQRSNRETIRRETVFETALTIHEESKPGNLFRKVKKSEEPGPPEKERHYWDVGKLGCTDGFNLGEHGCLKVVTALSGRVLIVEWTDPDLVQLMKTNAADTKAQVRRTLPPRPNMESMDDDAEYIRPIPLYVLSFRQRKM